MRRDALTAFSFGLLPSCNGETDEGPISPPSLSVNALDFEIGRGREERVWPPA